MKGKKFFDRLSLLPQGLRYKLLVAFSLMSIIPLLVMGYFVTSFVFAREELGLGEVSIITLVSIIIAWLGLILAKNIIERVIDLAIETKIISEGNFERKVSVDAGDEVGQIGEAINTLTKRIRNNISDLKGYQDKMREINVDIQKRVSVLSNLLQLGELISSSVKVDSILELALSKLAQLYEGGFAALYLSEEGDDRFTLRSSHNLAKKEPLTFPIEEGKGFLGELIPKKRQVIIDSSTKFSAEEEAFKTKYKCKNIVTQPIFIAKGTRAVLLVGNDIKDFTYTTDDVEIMKVFAEQISIAIENDILMKKAKKLEIKDELTGLFNKPYMLNRLNEEIQRSVVSQRPCSFILVDVDDFKKYQEEKGQPQAEIALKKIAQLISGLSTQVGKVGIIEKDRFALVLPEVNKKGALETAEKIRKGIERLELSSEEGDRLTASSGVSENPLDGASADEIYSKAEQALNKAKKEGKNKVVGLGV